MTNARIDANPFDLTKASDFSDQQIARFWVDLAGEGKLQDLFKPTSPMPMLLLGGKGSGKTHLMRYFSAPVQKLRHANLLDAVKAEKHLGIYVRADGLNVGRFEGKGQQESEWEAVFSYYFELWLASNFLKIVNECIAFAPGLVEEAELVADINGLFTKPLPNPGTSIASLIEGLAGLRKKVDYTVSNCAITKTLADIEICITPGQLVFEIPQLVVSHSHAFNDVLFVYMIDEIENFTASQQRFLNSLIRFRRGPVSLKIGARLYGIRTYEVLGSGEENRENAEFERVELDSWFRDHTNGYAELARKLVAKRLHDVRLADKCDIAGSGLNQYLEELDSSNHFRIPTLSLVKRYDDKGEERPYFKALRSTITSNPIFWKGSDATSVADATIQAISLPNDPLLEKVCLYLLYKDGSANVNIVKTARTIGDDARRFIAGGKEASQSFAQALDHFKSDFLAQIYRDCSKGSGRSVGYSGIDTLIHLSQGIPRNLLGLLKHIYRRSYFADEHPFQGESKISLNSQIEGVRDAASWFWDDSQPDRYGNDVRAAIESLAQLFRRVRFSLKPAECDLSTFTVGSKVGTETARRVLNNAENWSYLVRVRDGGVNRNDGSSIDQKYQLSPMLAPKWEVSEHRRGTIELKELLFNAIFDPELQRDQQKIFTDRLRGMEDPFSLGSNSNLDTQPPLF